MKNWIILFFIVSLFIEYRVKIILKEKSIKEEKLSSSDLFRRLFGYFQQAHSQVSPKEGGRGGGGGGQFFLKGVFELFVQYEVEKWM